MSPAQLKSRTIRSAGWVGLRLVVVGPLQLAYFSLLTWILEPEDFGAVSVCFGVLALSEAFSQTGVQTALMRHGGRIEDLLHPAWSLQVVRGLGLATFVLLIAVPVAHFQREPSLVPYLCATALVPAIDGLRSMGDLLLGRSLAQGRITLCEIVISVIHLAVGAALAWWLRSPWALVLSSISFAATRASYGYLIHDYRPRWTTKWGPLRPYLRFGIFYNLAAGVGVALLTIDKLLIGRWLGQSALGVYDRCFVLNQYVVQQSQRIFSATALPSLSAVRNDRTRFLRNMRRYGLLLAGLFLGGGALVLVGADLVLALLGEEYRERTTLFRLLVAAFALRGLAQGLQVLFDIFGKTQARFLINVVQLATLALALPTAIGWNTSRGVDACLLGAGSAALLTSAVGLLMTGLLLVSLLRSRTTEFTAAESKAGAPDGLSSVDVADLVPAGKGA